MKSRGRNMGMKKRRGIIWKIDHYSQASEGAAVGFKEFDSEAGGFAFWESTFFY